MTKLQNFFEKTHKINIMKMKEKLSNNQNAELNRYTTKILKYKIILEQIYTYILYIFVV